MPSRTTSGEKSLLLGEGTARIAGGDEDFSIVDGKPGKAGDASK